MPKIPVGYFAGCERDLYGRLSSLDQLAEKTDNDIRVSFQFRVRSHLGEYKSTIYRKSPGGFGGDLKTISSTGSSAALRGIAVYKGGTDEGLSCQGVTCSHRLRTHHFLFCLQPEEYD